MMHRFVVIMISLIIIAGCADDDSAVEFVGSELTRWQEIKADWKTPQYKWGYLDKNGALAISDLYDDLREFSQGRAVSNKGGLWGVIDKKGQEVLPHRFLTISPCSEDLIVAQDLNNRFHVFDRSGILVRDSLTYDLHNAYRSGRALVGNKGRYGYVDPNGKEVIPMDFTAAGDFENGLAIVALDELWGIIDTNGSEIVPIQYQNVWHPKSGMIRVRQANKYKFIDFDTKAPIKDSYVMATDYQDDYAIVNDGDKYLIMDKKGETRPLPYSLVDHGGEGKWMYATDARFGFLNNDGTVLCPPQYDLVMRYQEDRAGYAIADAWGYLDEKGQRVIVPQYPLVWDFVDGYARMINQNGFGFMNKQGENVMPSRYMEVRDFSEGLARIQVYR